MILQAGAVQHLQDQLPRAALPIVVLDALSAQDGGPAVMGAFWNRLTRVSSASIAATAARSAAGPPDTA